MKRALVLSSGGIDSTTCLSIAINELGADKVTSVSIFYGQKHDKELKQAEKIAEYYGINNYKIDLSPILRYNKNCSLLKDNEINIDHSSYSDQIKQSKDGMVSTYVPFRNGLMLSSVASLALSLFPDDEIYIYLGAHADDMAGAAYADCSEDFISFMASAITIGTYNKVTVVTPLIRFNKSEVVQKGIELKAPYHLTWSCYEGKDKPCGVCGTCLDRLKAFEENGWIDPILKI